MCRAVAAHEESDAAFAAHLKAIQTQRRAVNDLLRMRLRQIYCLPGYCGPHPSVADSLPAALANNSKLSSTALRSLQAHL
jgi:hypothetical protein